MAAEFEDEQNLVQRIANHEAWRLDLEYADVVVKEKAMFFFTMAVPGKAENLGPLAASSPRAKGTILISPQLVQRCTEDELRFAVRWALIFGDGFFGQLRYLSLAAAFVVAFALIFLLSTASPPIWYAVVFLVPALIPGWGLFFLEKKSAFNRAAAEAGAQNAVGFLSKEVELAKSINKRFSRSYLRRAQRLAAVLPTQSDSASL